MYTNNEDTMKEKMNDVSTKYLELRRKAFKKLHIIGIISIVLYLATLFIDPSSFLAILIPILNYLFFLFALYIIFYVLKGRGTIDTTAQSKRQFPMSI